MPRTCSRLKFNLLLLLRSLRPAPCPGAIKVIQRGDVASVKRVGSLSQSDSGALRQALVDCHAQIGPAWSYQIPSDQVQPFLRLVRAANIRVLSMDTCSERTARMRVQRAAATALLLLSLWGGLAHAAPGGGPPRLLQEGGLGQVEGVALAHDRSDRSLSKAGLDESLDLFHVFVALEPEALRSEGTFQIEEHQQSTRKPSVVVDVIDEGAVLRGGLDPARHHQASQQAPYVVDGQLHVVGNRGKRVEVSCRPAEQVEDRSAMRTHNIVIGGSQCFSDFRHGVPGSLVRQFPRRFQPLRGRFSSVVQFASSRAVVPSSKGAARGEAYNAQARFTRVTGRALAGAQNAEVKRCGLTFGGSHYSGVKSHEAGEMAHA